MSVVPAAILAVLGFVVLVILHELGHLTAAKAVGMRVERFSVFFPPLLARKTIGETEYGIGAIPLGGYVKISGMNPSEELPDEVRTRAYYSQPVWKRIVVILAGPLMNLILAFVLLLVFFWQVGALTGLSPRVAAIERGYPASGTLEPGDRIVSVDGQRDLDKFPQYIAAHHCAVKPPTNGCRAATPATVVVERHGHLRTLHLRPIYDKATGRTRLGFAFDSARQPQAFGAAFHTTLRQFWYVTHVTASLPVRIFNTHERKQLHGIVGAYETTRQTIIHDPGDIVGWLAIISLSLAIVNLFPFLPLDGGHIFWAVVELFRRKPVSYATMERSSVVGFALVAGLFLIGFTNDLSQLSNGGFGPG